jgi:hypothetical protein
MNKLIIAIAVCLSPQLQRASEVQTTKELKAEIEDLSRDHATAFNTAAYGKLKAFYHFPCGVLIDEEPQIATSNGKPLVNFENVKASEWASSKIKKPKVLSTNGISAIVNMSFARMTDQHEEQLTTMSFPVLTRADNEWVLKEISIAEDTLMG